MIKICNEIGQCMYILRGANGEANRMHILEMKGKKKKLTP
jgi:hypothetical protein